MTTEITDPATGTALAVEAMERNVDRIRRALESMAERMADLPPLMDARPEAKADGARLVLQAWTEDEVHAWARAFGETAEAVEEDGYHGGPALRTTSEFSVCGVPVRVVSYETFTASQWAARGTSAVAA
ncbi:hypothetical protein ACGFY7_23295 [Streptomyces prunicolor]|uniref:hypothetical protein n=1 Tax=Streptomyces prunicolor TaxID=67348 RepID=UPI0037210D2C